jgi:hypothetical protein
LTSSPSGPVSLASLASCHPSRLIIFQSMERFSVIAALTCVVCLCQSASPIEKKERNTTQPSYALQPTTTLWLTWNIPKKLTPLLLVNTQSCSSLFVYSFGWRRTFIEEYTRKLRLLQTWFVCDNCLNATHAESLVTVFTILEAYT